MAKELKQFEFPGMPTRHQEKRASVQFARRGFALMKATADELIDFGLANKLMFAPSQIGIKFEEMNSFVPPVQLQTQKD